MIHRSYKCLSNQIFELGDYKLIPIRFNDRYKIMKWRNDQIFHLRQEKHLTKKDQDFYFKKIINKQFSQKRPIQILFSFLKKNECIGYGGLVHINWEKKTAEISFLVNTSLEKEYFEVFWEVFLRIIQEVGFKELGFLKLFTFSYCLRPRLYKVLKKLKFSKERVLENFKIIDNQLYDARIDVIYSNNFKVKPVSEEDLGLLFEWVNEKDVRKKSINEDKISFNDHKKWFYDQLNNPKIKFYMVYEKVPVGVFRLKEVNEGFLISFSVSKENRGKQIGSKIIDFIVSNYNDQNLIAEVLEENKNSKKIFLNNEFILKDIYSKNNKQIYKFIKYSFK